MGVSTDASQPGSSATPSCVLVTDGDGSLNMLLKRGALGALYVRPRHRRGWESQPTGYRSAAPRRCAVRPRHRRGWESQRQRARSGQRRGRACVLVTDGDGSLNCLNEDHGPAEFASASSSPTGMGVSTPHPSSNDHGAELRPVRRGPDVGEADEPRLRPPRTPRRTPRAQLSGPAVGFVPRTRLGRPERTPRRTSPRLSPPPQDRPRSPRRASRPASAAARPNTGSPPQRPRQRRTSSRS